MIFVGYLLVLSIALFFIENWTVLGALLLLQLGLLIYSRVPLGEILGALRRIRLFFAIILVAYAFMPTGMETDRWLETPLLNINLSGLLVALFMCGRIACLVLASNWVQRVTGAEAFVAALCRFGLPPGVAVAIRQALALVGGARGRRGGRRRREEGTEEDGQDDRPGLQFRTLLKGDITPVHELMDWAFKRVDQAIADQDPDLDPAFRKEAATICAMTLAMMSFKMIVVVPGLMVAPGHKNVILLPLFLIAAQRTESRFGGMWTGLCMGMVNFMLGFGKLGLLDVVQFVLTGLLADLFLPFYRTRHWLGGILQLMVIGTLMGLARFSTNILFLLMVGAPMLGFAFLAPILLAQMSFGALSALPARALLARPPGSSPESG